MGICPALLGLLCTAAVAQASRAFQDRIPNGGGVVYAGAVWAAVGHVERSPATLGSLDSFGTAFKQQGNSWTSALCEADSDGDGYSNGQELGDPACTWTAGSTPARLTDISHPGKSDSVPVTLGAAQTAQPAAVPPVTIAPTPLPAGSATKTGNTPGTSTGGLPDTPVLVTLAVSSTPGCGGSATSFTIRVSDGVCREATVAPQSFNSGQPVYGAALCDSASGKVYVRTYFTSLADCTAAVGTKGKLIYDPATVVFDYSSSTASCVMKQIGTLTQYYKLHGKCVPPSAPLPPGKTVPNPPSAVDTPPPTDQVAVDLDQDDEAVPAYMIAILTILCIALVIVCVIWLMTNVIQSTNKPDDLDDVPPDEVPHSELEPAFSHRGPQGPPAHSANDLQGNTVVNPRWDPVYTSHAPNPMHTHFTTRGVATPSVAH